MRTIDVSLPDEVQAFVETQAEHAGYETPGKYVEAVQYVLPKYPTIACLNSITSISPVCP